ncbi:GIY-YIG nuclease family protein [Neobacillus sp. MM2021_6]|uniref:GIY-YIG nuclease family protein n=1 Tax=Bacillaceae TaxID=186817 RepID=UPI00140D22D8|nr:MULTISPECIES: GIY-YIG nuclease family protein [Bacillaceae]MBO0961751.1 GIY-YIG nuclease family protein [Neobacillus sp. MM2021_6]NHC19883.1 GIY-YIG nuclease family protein [Bacillus sp. MM2020_4]
MEKSEHFFYVVTCRDGSLYAGYTNNLERRIMLHNKGKGAKYTRSRGPVALTFYKGYDNKSDAMSAEYYFKKLSRKQKIEFLMEEMGGYHVAAEKF